MARVLSDGLAFVPTKMEEKWVIALRGTTLFAVRSWTGVVHARARGEASDGILHLREVELDPIFRNFGDPVSLFDWLIRSHALGQVLPVPCDAEQLEELADGLAFMSIFGSRALFAAPFWSPTPCELPLRTEGALLRAVRADDTPRIRRLVEEGAPVDQPSPTEGFTALHLAAVRGDAALASLLLELGANPRVRSDRGLDPAGMVIVHGGELALLATLVEAGAELDGANVDGFTLLHAAAEVDRPEIVTWLVDQGAALDATTERGLRPIHIACGLGHARALRALLNAGADPNAPSPMGTPRAIAKAEGKRELLSLLPK
ncbi:MAG: ankyrin repeat domain-containing protein [Myxococcota bacterium]